MSKELVTCCDQRDKKNPLLPRHSLPPPNWGQTLVALPIAESQCVWPQGKHEKTRAEKNREREREKKKKIFKV